MKLRAYPLIILSTAVALPVLISGAATKRVSLSDNWRFRFTETDPHADSSYRAALMAVDTIVNLPHDFQIHTPWVAPAADDTLDLSDAAANIRSRLSSRGFKECTSGSYTRSVTLPPEFAGKRVLLDIEGIMLNGKAFIDDSLVLSLPYGYLGDEVDVTDILSDGKPHRLRIEASTGTPENSRWYTGGGLYRDVSLYATDPDLYFGRHGLYVTTDSITEGSAKIHYSTDVNARKDSLFTLTAAIYDKDNKEIAKRTDTIRVDSRWRHREYTPESFTVYNPELWDTSNPVLYRLDVTLHNSEGEITDSISSPFGIRTIEYSPEFGFKLNGNKVFLKGIANHHTLGPLGAAAYPDAIEQRLRLLKKFGFNHIRTSHNPYSKEFLDLCDRYGFLVVDELYDKWVPRYTGGVTSFEERWQSDIPEFITRDRNHPSVIMWSLGNELQGYADLPFNDWGVTSYKLQKTLLERYDKPRPVTVAMHPRRRDLATDSLPAPLALETDIAAYNYRYMYFPGDRRRFPNLIFYQSEANLSNMGPNYWEPDTASVVGLAYWGMIDYLGESNGWPAKGWNLGVFDISLQPKPMAYFLKSIFDSRSPVAKIAIDDPHAISYEWNGVEMKRSDLRSHWNFAEGDSLNVILFTNADSGELFINGKSMGKVLNDTVNLRKRNRLSWDGVPYRSGVVTACAYRDGKIVARDTLFTAGKARRLEITTSKPATPVNDKSLVFVDIAAVDKKGIIDPFADDLLEFEVSGPAQIVAVANGDIYSNEEFTGNRRKLYRGKAQVILRLTGTSSSTPAKPVTLTIKGTNLKRIVKL